MFTITRLQRAYSRNAKAADHSLASPLFTNSKAIKATPPLAGGRKVALRFIATRHLLRYRSACGVRHRDIFSDPTMPKAGERERERERVNLRHRVDILSAHRESISFRSDFWIFASLSSSGWRGHVHARHRGGGGSGNGGGRYDRRPSTKLSTRGYFVRPIEGLLAARLKYFTN